MTADELALVAAVRDVFRARMKVNCTTCGYCQPCPSGVSIPDVFSTYNTSAMFDARQAASAVYRLYVMAGGHGADQCARCGECEPKCPQQIPIQDMLEEAHAQLTQTAGELDSGPRRDEGKSSSWQRIRPEALSLLA